MAARTDKAYPRRVKLRLGDAQIDLVLGENPEESIKHLADVIIASVRDRGITVTLEYTSTVTL